MADASADPVALRFRIREHTPETKPMARLAQCLKHLATLLGETNGVHLRGVKPGSIEAEMTVKPDAATAVNERLAAVMAGAGPANALEARAAMERFPAEDSASADLASEGDEGLLRFHPDAPPGEPQFGPFSGEGTLDGIPIVVGGRGDPAPARLRDVNRVRIRQASRDVAQDISRHLFMGWIRASSPCVKTSCPIARAS